MMRIWTLLLFACLMIWGCQKATSPQHTAVSFVAEDIGVTAFAEGIKNEHAQLLDVRTSQEWQEGVLPQAQLMDWQSSEFDSLVSQLDRQRPVYVYCASGGRSGAAMRKMTQMGFEKVYNLRGGIQAWTATGHRTVTPSNSK